MKSQFSFIQYCIISLINTSSNFAFLHAEIICGR